MADINGLSNPFEGLGKGLSDFKNSTNQALNKYKGDVVKAISPVQNKLKEGVATVKSTETKVANVITGYKDEVISGLDTITGLLTGGILNFDDVSKYISVGKNGVAFDKQGVASAIGNKIGLDLSSNQALMYQLTNMANGEFNDLTGGFFGNMVSTDGSGFRITQNWRDSLGTGFLDILGRTTGISANLYDKTLNTSYYNSLMKMSAQYGMSDSYSTIMASYNDPEDAKTALINSIPQMMQNGDLISMNKVLELVGQTKYAIINAKYPQLLSNLFSNFVLDQGTSPGNYPAIKTLFLNICNSIFGNEWYKVDTAFGRAYNFGLISSISEDMKSVLTSTEDTPELIPLFCAAGLYSQQDAIDVFKSAFPDAPILVTE